MECRMVSGGWMDFLVPLLHGNHRVGYVAPVGADSHGEANLYKWILMRFGTMPNERIWLFNTSG